MEGKLRVAIKETILTKYVKARAIIAPHRTRLLANRTDEKVTGETIQM